MTCLVLPPFLGGVSGKNIPILDGIRGIAALLVVAEHSGLTPIGTGANGVWLFFVLSGYLLAQPFANRWQFSLMGYIGRRVMRIMPMYIVYVLAAALLFHHHFSWVKGHLLLLFVLPLLAFNCYAANLLKNNPATNLFHHYNGLLGIEYALFVLWVRFLGDGCVYRFLSNRLFCAIGIVGYSFYLWHMAVLTMPVPKLLHNPIVHFSFAVVATYLIAFITYCLVERPCMQVGRGWKKKVEICATVRP